MNSHQRRKTYRADMRKWHNAWGKYRIVDGGTVRYEGIVRRVAVTVKVK